MEQRSYTVGENIDHIIDAAANVGAISRGKCLHRRHEGEEKQAVFSASIPLLSCHSFLHFQDLFKVHNSLFHQIMFS